MRTFSILTLGCKVNQYESAQIRQFLEGLGLSRAESGAKPDLFVINTCCVTSTASAKSRQFIQRALKANPEAKRVICGCLPAMNSRELKPPGNHNVAIISSREILPAMLTQIIIGDGPSIKAKNGVKIKDVPPGFAKFPKLPLLTSFKGHTRAFLKVQDGCDGTCSYCIIPKVRPNVQSKPIFEAVEEAKALVAAGHKEIVVTGVNLGAYGRQTVRRVGPLLQSQRSGFSGISAMLREDRRQEAEDRERRTENGGQKAEDRKTGFPVANQVSGHSGTFASLREDGEQIADCRLSIADLLEELAKIEGLRRLRVSSLEPGDINERLLDVFCAHKNIMPHIHLSVQSGSDNILRRMCRQYSAEELREKIELIKSRLDRPAITCDMIVGFPGETDEDFQQTVELAKWAGFSKMHVFGFSLREGTAAAKMKDKIQPKVVKVRSEILRRVGEELGHKFREQFIGENCEVLIENMGPGSADSAKHTLEAGGRCERYFVVKIENSECRKQKIISDLGPLFSAKAAALGDDPAGRLCG
ncbi:MAG: radical SAM protein [Sedimentisphaerales bacterium]|nr:radical SAM protein [Sedimentisphaerales bacterium]